MDAKSLRIGNIFSHHTHEGYCGDVFLRAEEIVMAQNDIAIFESRYCPYKITSQWLIDLGFEWIKEAGGYCLKDHIVYCMGEGDCVFNLFCSNDKDCNVKFQYVYQLQNLWFAVTGEDLVMRRKMLV